jgi:hypothetical protein
MFGYVHVYEHEHVHVQSCTVSTPVGLTTLLEVSINPFERCGNHPLRQPHYEMRKLVEVSSAESSE